MPDEAPEEYLTLAAARALVPGHPSVQTLRRWGRVGLCGGRVKLSVLRSGGRHFTTAAAVTAFNEALNAAARTPHLEAEPPAARKRDHQATQRRLKALGI